MTEEYTKGYRDGFKDGFQAGSNCQDKPMSTNQDKNEGLNYPDTHTKNYKDKEVKPIILDNNPLSIACYLEEHPEVDLDTSDPNHLDIGKSFDVKRTERALKSKSEELK